MITFKAFYEAMAERIDPKEINQIIEDSFTKIGKIISGFDEKFDENRPLYYQLHIPTFENIPTVANIRIYVHKTTIKKNLFNQNNQASSSTEGKYLSVQGQSTIASNDINGQRYTNSGGVGSTNVVVHLKVAEELWHQQKLTEPKTSDFTIDQSDDDDNYWGSNEYDTDKFKSAMDLYTKNSELSKQNYINKWQSIKKEYENLMQFILLHELGHSQRNLKDPNYTVRKAKSYSTYQRGGLEWDANLYALRSFYDKMTPEQRKTITYDQFVNQSLPNDVYKVYMSNPKWREKLIRRMQREGIILGK